MYSQNQNQNQVNNSADDGNMQDSGMTDRFAQGQQQGQGRWGTDSGGGSGGGQQYGTTDTSPDTDPPDVLQRSDPPTSHRVGEYPRGEDKSESLTSAASGPTGGGGLAQSSTQQTQQPSSSDKVPGTASWDSQRADMDTGAQYGRSDSKFESSTGTQVGDEGTGQTAGVGVVGGTAASGTTGPKGLKNIVTGVQGASEAIRGKVMQGVDEVFGYDAGVEKNREIAEAGMGKMRAAKGGQGTASGVGGLREEQGDASQTGAMGSREK